MATKGDAQAKAAALTTPLRKAAEGTGAKVKRTGAVVTITAGKAALSNGAAAVKALGDAITGGNGTVEVAHALTFERPVEVHLSMGEVVSYLVAKEWEERNSGPDFRRFWHQRGAGSFLARIPVGGVLDAALTLHEAVAEIARHEDRQPLDVVTDILALARTNATVEGAPCGKHDAATGSGIGWQAWCPGCDPTLHREGEEQAPAHKEDRPDLTHRWSWTASRATAAGGACRDCSLATRYKAVEKGGNPVQVYRRDGEEWTTTCPRCPAKEPLSLAAVTLLEAVLSWTDAPPPRGVVVPSESRALLRLLRWRELVAEPFRGVNAPQITAAGRAYLDALPAVAAPATQGPAVDSKASVAVRHALLTVREGLASLRKGSTGADRRVALVEAEDFVQGHLDHASGDNPVPAIDAAICRLVAVASPAKGVREDEVLRFLEALELDADRGEKRLAALVRDNVLTWHEQKGKPDAPLVYRRGPAFAKGAAR